MMILNGSIGYKWSMLVVIVVIFDVMPTLHGCSSSNDPGKFIQMEYLTHKNTSRYKSNLYIIFAQIGDLKIETKQGDERNPTERAVTLGKDKNMNGCI